MKLFLAQSWGPLQAQLSYLLRNMIASPQRRKCADAARIAAGETAISHNSRQLTTASVGVFVALTLAGLAMPRQAAADEVFDWNVTGFEATLAGGQNAILISRTMAMMQLAIHDALNAIEPRYEPYLYEGKAEPSADAGAAIAAAAHDVLAAVIPGWGKPEQRAKALAIVDGAYSTALGKLRDGPAKEHGVAVGQAIAAAMLAARKSDNSTAPLAIHARDGAGQMATSPQSRAGESSHPRSSPCRRKLASIASPMGTTGAFHDGNAVAVPLGGSASACERAIR
jgi:hypothetical protein